MRPEWIGISALVILPTAALLGAGAAWRWFAYGVFSWSLALVLKLIGLVVLYTAYEAGIMPLATCAGAHGIMSAACELGLAAVFFRSNRLPLKDVLAFGTGIGSFEALWVLAEGSLELAETKALTLASFLDLASGQLLFERALSLLGHISSRLLVYASLSHRKLLPGLLAFILFALVDGTAAYGTLAQWNWSDSLIQTRFQWFIATVGGIEVLTAYYFGQSMPWHTVVRG